MGIRLILVCKEGPARLAYLCEAKSVGIEVDSVATFGELLKSMTTTAYQRVMIDLVTSVKASKEEKSLVHDILKVFPMLQLKWESETNTIFTISYGNQSRGSSLAHFITQECQPFKPRAIRLNARKSINFNILLSRQEDINESTAEHTVIINTSKSGCFVFSCDNWSDASEAWLVICELQDKTPILGEIRRWVPWGKTMTIPGIGIRFKQIKPQQLEELIEEYSL
jgi:hypothetical protein